jgi:hypothetical protein
MNQSRHAIQPPRLWDCAAMLWSARPGHPLARIAKRRKQVADTITKGDGIITGDRSANPLKAPN